MRLFYQSFGVSRGSRDGAYGQLSEEIVEAAAAPGTEIDIQGLSPNRAIADQYRYLEFLDTAEVLENGLRAEREGYDAFLIGNIFQPGLHELRELLNIPVLGLRESTVHVACLMGASFSLVNVNPKFVHSIVSGRQRAGPRVPDGLDRADDGGPPRAASTRRCATPRRRRGSSQQFVEVAKRGLDKGAEVLIPAGGSLMAVLHDAGVHEVEGSPVLNGLVALVKIAELAVQMRRVTGTFTSQAPDLRAADGKLLADIRAAYGDTVYPGAILTAPAPPACFRVPGHAINRRRPAPEAGRGGKPMDELDHQPCVSPRRGERQLLRRRTRPEHRRHVGGAPGLEP